MSDPLDPDRAARLFFSGEVMAYVSSPDTPFVCGRWMNDYALCTQLPFASDTNAATAYFTDNPVVLWEGAGDGLTPEVPPSR